MVEFDCQQIVDYFLRSYRAVDGLWFMKVEEQYGFDRALDIDNEVWKVMSKIQARMIKSMLKLNNGPDALFKSLTAKLKLEGFKFKAEKTENGFRITINDCPWHNLMIKSGRDKLSGAVGTTICGTEYQVWVSEFDETIHFKFKSQKCNKSKYCILEFKR
ncbi:MAG: L-2-amino-thiazoline-4-carboxylic acid hydrolase [Candidatus Bathyarchaeum sp.]|nr:MAG: L-2-amino-thiazoline-4-carboxylic acid hydrolase [Candidatus Bathyarchaeum sp.]